MTTDKPLPTLLTPAEALREAIGWARRANYAESDNSTAVATGRLWLDIARELREGTRRAGPPRSMPWAGNDPEGRLRAAGLLPSGRKLSPDPEAPEPRQPVPDNIGERMQLIRRPADLRFGEPIKWQIGDKADCVHCRTPIEYALSHTCEAGSDGKPGTEAPRWRHRYTQQAVCMAPTTGDTMTDVEATAVHTFAEPPSLHTSES